MLFEASPPAGLAEQPERDRAEGASDSTASRHGQHHGETVEDGEVEDQQGRQSAAREPDDGDAGIARGSCDGAAGGAGQLVDLVRLVRLVCRCARWLISGAVREVGAAVMGGASCGVGG